MKYTPAEHLSLSVCPLCDEYATKSEYLAGVFSNNPILEYFANLITHYRHSHIKSWNRMWGTYGRSYRSAAGFGDYDKEKAIVNERAKRQLIRQAYPIFKEIGLTAAMVMELENTTPETLGIANQFLDGKCEFKEKKMEVLTDQSIMSYGMHKGKALANIPAEYFLWLWNEKKLSGRPEMMKYVGENLDVLRKQAVDDKRKK